MAYKKYTQEELYQLSVAVMERADELFSLLNLDFQTSSKCYIGRCPIHDGNNRGALNIYYGGDYLGGNWKCRTAGCDKIFQGGSILGFIRGVLSSKNGWSSSADTDKVVSFGKVLKFAKDFVGGNFKEVDNMTQEKNRFVRTTAKLAERKVNRNYDILEIDREVVRKTLQIPASYYLEHVNKDKRYSLETLTRYDVGYCDDASKPFYSRVIVPIYDETGQKMVACTGRSIYERCSRCGAHHSINRECPHPDYRWAYSKWKNTPNVNDWLYNYWEAKDKVHETNTLIIVESPGNVWRLVEAGVENVVGIFGTDLTEMQKQIIDESGTLGIITLMDNDKNEAGRQAAERIKDKCKNLYRVVNCEISGYNDVGEMPLAKIKTDLVPIFKSVENIVRL